MRRWTLKSIPESRRSSRRPPTGLRAASETAFRSKTSLSSCRLWTRSQASWPSGSLAFRGATVPCRCTSRADFRSRAPRRAREPWRSCGRCERTLARNGSRKSSRVFAPPAPTPNASPTGLRPSSPGRLALSAATPRNRMALWIGRCGSGKRLPSCRTSSLARAPLRKPVKSPAPGAGRRASRGGSPNFRPSGRRSTRS